MTRAYAGEDAQFTIESKDINRNKTTSGTLPTPYTLHPTPYTLHPAPYTLQTKPYILHPQPSDMNP